MSLLCSGLSIILSQRRLGVSKCWHSLLLHQQRFQLFETFCFQHVKHPSCLRSWRPPVILSPDQSHPYKPCRRVRGATTPSQCESRAQGSQAKAVGSGTRQWARRGARLHSAHGDLTGSGHRDWCSLVFAKYTEVANCYVTKCLMASDVNERCKHELTVHITETLRCNQHKQPQPIQVVRHNSKGNFKIIKVAVFRVPNTRRHVIGCWAVNLPDAKDAGERRDAQRGQASRCSFPLHQAALLGSPGPGCSVTVSRKGREECQNQKDEVFIFFLHLSECTRNSSHEVKNSSMLLENNSRP